jgi:prophage regulatory protein
MKEQKIIRCRQLVKLIGIGRSTLYDWLNPKSPRYDPTFPKKIKLGTSSVGWLLDEVEAWIESKAKARAGYGCLSDCEAPHQVT